MNEELEIKDKSYLKKFNKIYIWFASFSDDLLFYVAISTLFYTIVKGFSAQEIISLTTISSIISILIRIPLIKVIQKIGSTNSVRIGNGLALIASILITFGNSYITIVIAESFYAIAVIFKNMLSVILKNNLIYQNHEDNFIKIQSKVSSIYAIITTIVALTAGFLFNINNYIPMYLCIFICLICFITSFSIKEVNIKNSYNVNEVEKIKLNFTRMLFIIFVLYGLFYGLITIGQKNGELLIQYELIETFNIEQTAIYLSIIVAISRIARVISNMAFNTVYKKYKNRINLILGIMIFSAFSFMTLGYFINLNYILKFTIMSLGFFIILMIRDPFRIYMQDVTLKITDIKQHKLVIAYLEFSRKLGNTILGLIVSSLLVKIDMIYVISILGILAFLQFFVILKLYNLLKKKYI